MDWLLIIGAILTVCGIILFIPSLDNKSIGGTIVGSFLIILGILAIRAYFDRTSASPPKYVFLPEQYRAIERGDTLRITKKENVMEIQFFHGGDSSNLYIVK